MSNVIQLLERLGEDANLSDHTLENLKQQMQDLELSEVTQKAILEGDANALETLMNLSPIVCGIIIEDDEDSPDENEDEPQQPSQAVAV
ncbi:hypothetical protein [Thalassotalea sp. PS06]|uniref:hypothetical protein n=1 Tax=Thalassotalea sp. PS06 TaxID=2594005 RepID=UPI001164874F|nr:hypothetical protein [Thalassotalea sp. PS06]QDP00432.1 hypothetical protein FNC98_03130 [Thalassotalea sp. PS06]